MPVVAIGGQETALFLTRGERLARLLALDRLLRLKVLPISISLPWGVNVGDSRPHPAARQDHRRGAAADPPARRVRPRPRRRRGLRPRHPADAGHARRARRRASLPGDRMRIGSTAHRSPRPIEDVWRSSPTPSASCTSCPASRAGRSVGEQATGLGARYRMLMRVGSAEVGGLVEVVEFDEPARPRLDLGRPASTSAAAGGCARRPAAAPGSSCAWPTASRAPGSSAGWPSRSPRPTVRGPRPPHAAAAQAPGRARAAARGRRPAARPPRAA